MFEANARRLRREHNDRVQLAYEIVRLTRMPKPPPLKQLLIPLDPPANPVAPWAAQRAAEKRALAAVKKKRRG